MRCSVLCPVRHACSSSRVSEVSWSPLICSTACVCANVCVQGRALQMCLPVHQYAELNDFRGGWDSFLNVKMCEREMPDKESETVHHLRSAGCRPQQ